jgi:hypothetical protein
MTKRYLSPVLMDSNNISIKERFCFGQDALEILRNSSPKQSSKELQAQPGRFMGIPAEEKNGKASPMASRIRYSGLPIKQAMKL